ncbi:MAG: prepilin-type N-terminal cleavage/methylation domain-containing protein [Clostridiales bacterium]|nr:prepilin-type N-terminal cleavage/methylation domain-containing protein [Clostridiales bacterium]MBR6987095.1 prepilin-type N-terminal cleavage/methylation domain-containing protein [Clostridiales bacterium]
MKRRIKRLNRKGFTLVETLLSAVILVVISTMLFNGFIATMGFSYQTSVYVKSGANNYTACMNEVAQWSHLENTGADGREVRGKAYYTANGSSATSLEFDCGSWPYTLEELNVEIIAYTDLKLTVPNTVNGYEFSPNNESLADNRKAIVYYPEYWQGSNASSLGKVIVMYNAKTNKYYWVVDNGNKNLAGAEKVSNTPIHSS